MTAADTAGPGDIRFSRGSDADGAELAVFAARTFEDTFSADNSAEDMGAHRDASYGVRQQTAELRDPEVVTILARSDTGLVAYAQVRRKAWPSCVTESEPVELHRFYLDRGMHGSGLATTLMHRALEAGRELGGRHLWLGVWERNPRAIAFYRKCGFVDVGSHLFTVGSDRQTDRILVVEISVAERRVTGH